MLYRRDVLLALDGFDERYLKAQDAELAYRLVEAGHELRFTRASRVKHYHEDRLGKYLKIQAKQGYWRAWLHLDHEGTAAAIPTATNSITSNRCSLSRRWPSCRCCSFPGWRWIEVSLLGVLMALQLPLTCSSSVAPEKSWAWLFAPMSFLRAFWRAVGLALGLVNYVRSGNRRARAKISSPPRSDAP